MVDVICPLQMIARNVLVIRKSLLSPFRVYSYSFIMNATDSFETSTTSHHNTAHRIPVDSNFKMSCFGNETAKAYPRFSFICRLYWKHTDRKQTERHSENYLWLSALNQTEWLAITNRCLKKSC